MTWALRYRLVVLSLAFLIFAGGFALLSKINKEMLPTEDQRRFNIRLKTPIGSSVDYSDERFKDVEKFLASRSEVASYVLQVGGGSPGDSNKGSILVTMKDPGSRGVDAAAGHELSQQEFMGICRGAFK